MHTKPRTKRCGVFFLSTRLSDKKRKMLANVSLLLERQEALPLGTENF